MHNALRRAFGQPIGVDNSTLGVDDPFVRNYLSYIVFIHPAPEPGSQILLSAGLVLLLGLD